MYFASIKTNFKGQPAGLLVQLESVGFDGKLFIFLLQRCGTRSGCPAGQMIPGNICLSDQE